MQDLQNVLASDFYDDQQSEANPNYLGTGMSNAIFHLDKGHPFLDKSVQVFPRVFNGQWGSGGPDVFSQAFLELCGVRPGNFDKECQGVTRMPPR